VPKPGGPTVYRLLPQGAGVAENGYAGRPFWSQNGGLIHRNPGKVQAGERIRAPAKDLAMARQSKYPTPPAQVTVAPEAPVPVPVRKERRPPPVPVKKEKKPCISITLSLLPGSLTVRDIACHVRKPEKTVRLWLNKGLLVGWKDPSGDWHVRKSSYEHFIAQRRNTYYRELTKQAALLK